MASWPQPIIVHTTRLRSYSRVNTRLSLRKKTGHQQSSLVQYNSLSTHEQTIIILYDFYVQVQGFRSLIHFACLGPVYVPHDSMTPEFC